MTELEGSGPQIETLVETGGLPMSAETEKRVERRYGSILFADVHAYSRLIERNEESAHRAVTDAIQHFRTRANVLDGEIVHVAGDGFVAFFANAVDAVRFALEIHAWMHNARGTERARVPIRFRVGVNVGEVINDEDGIYGESVIIATRLQELAEPGGTCVSDGVFHGIRKVLDLGYEYIGPQRLKNMARNIEVYRLHAHGSHGRMAPGVRYEKADDKTADEWLDIQPSVAVLPFRNLSGNRDDEYLADGITEDIITNLSRFRNLFVIARNSAFVFKEQSVPISKICRRLHARYVVLGSIRKAGERIRVSVHLVEGSGEKNLWTEQYDRDLGDIFGILDEITTVAASALAIHIEASERERLGTKAPSVLEAYSLVLQGQQRIFRYSHEDNDAARRLYEAALQADPRYARAYAAMSRTYNLDWRYSWSAAPERCLDDALRLARHAVELDPADARGYAELGYVHLYRREHDASINAYERAVRLNPNDADILAEMADSLNHAGRPGDALPLFERAMRLNPYYPDEYLWLMAGAHFKLRDYERVIQTVNKMQNMTEGRRVLAASYAYLGRIDEARHHADLVRRTHPNFTAELWRKRYPDRNMETAEHFIEGLRKAGL